MIHFVFRDVWGPVLVGLESKAMLMIGGRAVSPINGENIKDIWLMKDGSWSQIGSLQEVRK